MGKLVELEAIRRVAVIGAGTMGHGVAQASALAGWAAVIHDVDEGRIARGLQLVAASLARAVEKGKLDAAARDEALARVTGSPSLEGAVARADVVVEAVPEDLELKRRTFAALDAAAPPGALLATNTSALPVGRIAAATSRPGHVVGMHFFNPVQLMKLLEVVRHDAADEAAVELARAVGVRLGKQPIVVRDAPGFASSRLGIALGMEAIRMLEAGVASAHDIDLAMKLGYGHPMGPLELTDHVGLDVRLAIAEHLEREIGPGFRPPALLRRLVAEGKLGRKTGEGFHVWRDGKLVGA